MELGRRHWTVALGAALVAHAGVAAALLWQVPDSGARQAGLGGIEVSLGPAGGAPGDPVPAAEVPETQAAEAVPAAAEAPVAAPPPEPPPEEVPIAPAVTEAPSEEPVEEVRLEALSPEEPPTEEPVVEAPPEESPVPEATRQPEVAEPVEAREVETAAVEPPPPPVEVERAAPVPPVEPPAPEATAPRAPPAEVPEPETVAAVSSALSGTRGKAGTQESTAAGSGESRSGGGRPGAAADYAAVLQAWLEKHKEYPRRAQRRRQEGIALLYFVMARDGRVLDYRIQESSGHSLLDREVERMIERAQPLPEIPPELRQARLELVVPVHFLMR